MYVYIHHIGIGLIYLCFWAWASMEKEEDAVCRERGVALPIRCVSILLGTLAMGISLFWSVASCTLDIGKTYAAGRNEARFIKEHHLERYRIMAGWMVIRDEAGNIVDVDINSCDQAVNAAPYFEHNLFFNFNEGKDERNYVTHMRLTQEQTQTLYDVWRKEELPQVLWMHPNLEMVYGDILAGQNYVPVYREPIERIWKAGTDYSTCDIYVSRELLEETGLSMIRVGE